MIHTTIKETDVFDRAGLTQALGLANHTVGREVRKRRLRAYRRAGRDYFLGADVLEWLRAGRVHSNGRADDADDDD